MKILTVGDPQNIAELKSKFSDSSHQITAFEDHHFNLDLLEDAEVIFDFLIEENPNMLWHYAQLTDVDVFLNAAKISLGELHALNESAGRCFGFNGLPTFFNRAQLELSIFHNEDMSALENACKSLNTAYLVVADRVGMVTPRVIAMIINEAYYTVQEGTASKADIDEGMKLGTNYPYGPFEWCQRIGLAHVYELLKAVYDDTKDERYKIAPLLKQEYLRP